MAIISFQPQSLKKKKDETMHRIITQLQIIELSITTSQARIRKTSQKIDYLITEIDPKHTLFSSFSFPPSLSPNLRRRFAEEVNP